MAIETIPAQIQDNGSRFPSQPAYWVKKGDQWESTSWGEYADLVKTAARSLIALGVQPGQVVTIIGFNRPEWVIADVAAMSAGAVPAGIYTTNSPDELAYIVNHSESPLIVIEDEGQWAKVQARLDEMPKLNHVVTMAGCPPIDHAKVLSWEEFLERAGDVDEAEVDARIASLDVNALATLIYTSGTTGRPKGVMLSHDNLFWTGGQGVDLFDIQPSDRLVSYLPLSHIAEQVFTIHAAARAGFQVYYAESIEALPENLKEVNPTVFFAVPRVWEKFQAGVAAKLKEATGVKAKLAAWSMKVAAAANAGRTHGKEPGGKLAMQYKVADRLVLSKVKAALGLGEARVMAVSAAPISPEVLEFFASLDLLIYEIYGQSEGTGPTTINKPGRIRFNRVGLPWPGSEVKIAEDGEILLKGRNVFQGYFRDEEATAETLIDGWLYSGDLGTFDEEGFLHITGRKKDIIITAGGKNVAPKAMETPLKNHHLVSEVVVIGDRRKYLTALFTLDEEACGAFLAERGLTSAPHETKEIIDLLQVAVDEVNDKMARVEQIKKFSVLPRQLTIEDGELTPTLKVKRNKVAEHFAHVIDSMYAE